MRFQLIAAVSLLMVLTGFACKTAVSQNRAQSEATKFVAEMQEMIGKSDESNELSHSHNPHVRTYSAIVKASVWPQREVYVCWENGSSDHVLAMSWTREAVLKTWEKESGLKFLGWEACAETNEGIRILIEDSGPHVKALGRFLNRKPKGMVLNFTFDKWSSDCKSQLEYCVKVIAVHEFGHAIGFVHEQNRPDAPGECKTLAQGSAPDTLLTPYDPDSVMNYCNKKWSNDGILSALDISAVRQLYGNPKL